ncbi:carboxymuconolactone decarboxylase family protein [Undibacterium terreum]|uniref:Alkyl hydroperoxide reductase AhpD n=1 Tax=Undibacterium terreum TaxID=1224302 RepID=A0A916UUJ4_9BURK|nr:carboxymuconolactone decarboxylase family protein [Undibacterium terreum]GGC89024.1 alkyl hydroperoxide reductase AhpD [Undibacterium terreum]
MSQRFDIPKSAPDAYKGLGSVKTYLQNCSLSPVLVELVNLRVSQINGCAFCIDMHSRNLLKKGVSIDKLVLVAVWQEGGTLFDAQERAALAWAESVTNVAETGVPDISYEAAAAVFSEKEMSDLTVTIALMNAFNRIGVSARLAPAAAR